MSDNERDVAGDGIARLPVSTPEMGCQTRKMQPAVVDGTTPPQPVVDLSGVRESEVERPLSVGVPEFSPKMDSRTRETSASVTRSNAAGTVAPVDFAGLSVPVVSGIQFSAVAEVHSSAMDLVDDTLVVRAHEQQSSGRGDPRGPPGIVDRPVTNPSTLEPLEHSVLGEDLDSRPLEGLSVPEPLEHSVLVETLDGRPMEGLLAPEPLEHSVLDEVLDGGPMEGSPDPGPLEHLVPEVILERSSRKKLSALEPLEHSVPEVILNRSSRKKLSASKHIRSRYGTVRAFGS